MFQLPALLQLPDVEADQVGGPVTGRPVNTAVLMQRFVPAFTSTPAVIVWLPAARPWTYPSEAKRL